jgi:2-alkenal reductase
MMAYTLFSRLVLRLSIVLFGTIYLTGCTVVGNLPIPGVQQPVATPAPEPAARAPDNQQEEPSPTRDPSAPTPTLMPDLSPQPTIEPALRAAVEGQEALLVAIYRLASPAVVSIDVSGQLDLGIDLPEGHPFGPDDSIPLSRGSGFLFDSQGHIITNNHVVENADTLQVTFFDGSKIEATLVGTDPGSDLAVIKVDRLPPEVAPLSLGSSDDVQVGQMAIAIGNPFGLQNTLTLGIISGLGRSLVGPQATGSGNFSIPNIIQTDAAINPGNSGGPLLNVRAEVIGVNTAISSQSGSFMGVAYAIPSQVVERIVPVLIEEGTYAHPWIGISMFEVDALVAERFDLAVNSGVLVTGVMENSPADDAGLRPGSESVPYAGGTLLLGGDIITAIEEQEIRTSDDLISYLQLNAAVGDTLTLTVVRDGEEQNIEVTLAARPPSTGE